MSEQMLSLNAELDAQILKNIIFLADKTAGVTESVKTISLLFRPDVLRTRSYMSGSPTLLAADIPVSMFKKYECPSEIGLGLDIDTMKAILKRTKKDDVIALSIENNKLAMTFRGKKFFARTVIADTNWRELPPFERNGEIITDMETALEIIKDLDFPEEGKYTDTSVKMNMENSILTIARFAGAADYETIITTNDEWSVKGNGEAKLNIEHLKRFISNDVNIEKIKIMLGNKVPIMISTIDETIRCYIAPLH